MSPRTRDAKKQAKARQHRRLQAQERLARDRRQAQQADFSNASFQRACMRISGRYPMKALHTQEVMGIPIQHWRGGKGVSAGVALRQCLQQCLRLLQVSGVKPFGEPAVDRRQ